MANKTFSDLEFQDTQSVEFPKFATMQLDNGYEVAVVTQQTEGLYDFAMREIGHDDIISEQLLDGVEYGEQDDVCNLMEEEITTLIQRVEAL